MAPRKVSLRVEHATACPRKGQTTLESALKRAGCKCEPSYYTFQRRPDGSVSKGPRVKDRHTADTMLHEAQVELDRGRAGLARPKVETLHAWLDEFETLTQRRVDNGELKPRTLEGYAESLVHARKAIADIPLRDIGPAELRAFDDRSRSRPLARRCARRSRPRGSGTCGTSPRACRPPRRRATSRRTRCGRTCGSSRAPASRPPKRGKAPFEDAELDRLWVALSEYEPVYLAVCRFSAETGLRLGELVALEWSNVPTGLDRVFVEHHWDEEHGLLAPKDRETRWVYLTPYARAVLEEWLGVVGEAEPTGPVFPNPLTGDRLTPRIAQRRLADAMEDAGVPKEHPDLRLPRSFHSLRYTTSVLMQRRGYHPRLIEQTLGHGSLELSFGVYGGWTPEQLAAEAGREQG